ncbi:MAG: dTDP-4-dehydrorhamnose 3,5-epimerase [Shackletoniella antarctica]|jgi:dTDP-4-dehydrorhamnose 3,5-epimerase|uniref:dTDP-4-dehydrorhamnose 3,5-epimerase n=1 Tax=Shackletoniella antarctica TaxID=268115 RepID=A0A2W4VW22_9CYAN|nr:MAG: dTDP-4-dehydrorhamnose 3,5-epimerase [Shackletoniella antarctica]
MIFEEIPLRGVFTVSLDQRKDDRGFFSRAYCTQEFEDHGLKPVGIQCNLASNYLKGTLRGLHYQVQPAAEAKFFRCIQGANYHVIVDMRPDSPTYLNHYGIELSAENRLGLYVPELFAHGYQALTDDSEAFYMVSEYYTPGCERGLRHDDPALNIRWPLPVTTISEKDTAWPLLPGLLTI